MHDSRMTFDTLPGKLRYAALKHPELGIFLVGEESNTQFLSYADLLRLAEGIAGSIMGLGMRKGDKAIIATETNRETLLLLWGCVLAGIVPTILQPPTSFTESNPAASKILNVFRQLHHPTVFLSQCIATPDPVFAQKLVVFADVKPTAATMLPEVAPEDLAFIQFSSGSTGDPKGIMLTHINLFSNTSDIIDGLDLKNHDHGGSWMPLYHDMGLIGFHFTPLYRPCMQYHIETIDFIKNPGLWLDAISKYGITITGCPNFGQALLLRYLKRRGDGASWKLSSIKALLNGAEPISVKIMEEFTHLMGQYGFRANAMMPVYGMAEATLAITFHPLGTLPVITAFDEELLDQQQVAARPSTARRTRRRSIVSVGKALPRIQYRIVDEQDGPIGPNQAGHIQVRGEAVTQGYYQLPEASAAVFDGEWLRTGDIGFEFEENLYISGRYKDIIFLNGRNYFAHDLENLACSLDTISYGKVIVGGMTDPKSGKEKVLVFVAGIPTAKAAEVLHSLRAVFRKKMGVRIDELILIRPNEIAKTSSGKIQRYQIIRRYGQGDWMDMRYH